MGCAGRSQTAGWSLAGLQLSLVSFYLRLFAVVAFILAAAAQVTACGHFFAFYAAEWLCVLSAFAAAPFLGVVGFFCLNAVVGFLSLFALLQARSFFLDGGSVFFGLGELFSVPGSTAQLALYVDTTSYAFSLLTCLIGAFVYVYAFSYMRLERSVISFLAYLQLFKLSMVLLVWAGTWFVLILGWELIGVTSFLLINF